MQFLSTRRGEKLNLVRTISELTDRRSVTARLIGFGSTSLGIMATFPYFDRGQLRLRPIKALGVVPTIDRGLGKSMVPDESATVPESELDWEQEGLRLLRLQLTRPQSVIPFVGAGFSASLGFPLWSDFLLDLARKNGCGKRVESFIRRGEYEDAAETLMAAMPRQEFNDAIGSAFGDHNLEGQGFPKHLLVLPCLFTGPVITTNFDHAVERVYEQLGQPFEQVVTGAKPDTVVGAIAQDHHVLLKVHGDVNESTERVLTTADYQRAYGVAEAHQEKPSLEILLQRILSSRPVLFLGCSLQHDRIMDILSGSAEGAAPIPHFAVVGRPKDENEATRRKNYLYKRSVRPVWYPDKQYALISTLLNSLEEDRSEALHLGATTSPSTDIRGTEGHGAATSPVNQPGGDIPYRHPLFTGRESELADLLATFAQAASEPIIVAITGIGGVGKTQLVLEYIKRHRQDYEHIFWIRGDHSALLASDYADLAQRLDVPDDGNAAGATSVHQRVRIHLSETEEHSLLVFDNAASAADLRSYLPQTGFAHVLVTSQNPAWRGIGSVLPLTGLAESDAVQFIQRRAGKPDTMEARDLARELGYLPLALEQAAAFLESSGMDISQYLVLLQEPRYELLGYGIPLDEERPSVAETWSIALERAWTSDAKSIELLMLLAFLAPDGIRLADIAFAASQQEGEEAELLADSLGLYRLTETLRRYSLVESDQTELRMHSLLQTFLRGLSTEEVRQAWAAHALVVVWSLFPTDPRDPMTWPECARLLNHALVATEHGRSFGVRSEHLGALLNQIGIHLSARGQHGEAEKMLRLALEAYQDLFGPDNLPVASSQVNLAASVELLGRLDEAQDLLEQSLRILRHEEPSNPAVRDLLGIASSNLGTVLMRRSMTQEATEQLTKALAIHETLHGSTHPTVAIDRNNIGGILRQEGRWEEALPLYEHAVRDLRRYGSKGGHLAVSYATALANLSTAQYNTGDLQKAKDNLLKAKALDESLFPEGHENTVRDLQWLGYLSWFTGSLAVGLTYLTQALEMSRRVQGDEHWQTKELKRHRGELTMYILQPVIGPIM